MSYQEEKKEIFENILKDFNEEKNYSEINAKIKELFFKDSNNGKLYKYRGFDESGYTIDALETETLYCGNKKLLNDVFELEFAYAPYSFIEKMHPHSNTKLSDAIENITEYIFGKNKKLSFEEKEIVRKIFKDKKMVKIILQLRNKRNVNEERETKILFFYKFLLHKINESDILGNDEKIDSGFLKNMNDIMNTYSKSGVNFNEPENFKNLIIRYCSTSKQEEYLQSLENVGNGIKQLSELVSRCFNIGCLTTEHKNRLMWSHYGNSYTGICIEYDFKEGFDEIGDEYLLLPVLYSEERPVPPLENMYTGENLTNEWNNAILSCAITKDSIWNYENEWRILLPAQNGNKIRVPKISCIYLGVKIKDENREKVLKIARKKGIPVKQMKICDSMYGLKEDDVLP